MSAVPPRGATDLPVFYYDLGDPVCYLVAERILGSPPVLGGRVVEWEPVLRAELGASVAPPERRELERRVLELGIQPLRWPERWPPDTRTAMLAATYAKRIGRAVTFSLAAFRQAFAGGRDLGTEETILLAGAASEIHPAALLKAIALPTTAAALQRATDRAHRAGVRALPAIQAGDELFGEFDAAVRALEQA